MILVDVLVLLFSIFMFIVNVRFAYYVFFNWIVKGHIVLRITMIVASLLGMLSSMWVIIVECKLLLN